MHRRSIFDCDSDDVNNQQSERMQIAYDDDWLSFGDSDINKVVSTNATNSQSNRFNEEKSNNYDQNIETKNSSAKMNVTVTVSTNSNIRRAAIANDRVDYSHDRYKLKDLIGSGTYGKVYKAYDNQYKEIIAVKRIQCGTTKSVIKLKNQKPAYYTQINRYFSRFLFHLFKLAIQAQVLGKRRRALKRNERLYQHCAVA